MSRLNLFSISTVSLFTLACAEVPTLSIGGEPLPEQSSALASASEAPQKGAGGRAVQVPSASSPTLNIGDLDLDRAEEEQPTPVQLRPLYPFIPRRGDSPEPPPVEDEVEEPTTSEPSDPPVSLELRPGDLCSYSVATWAEGCQSSKDPGCMLQGEDFKVSYPDALVIGQAPLQITLSSIDAVAQALPPTLDAAPLTESLIDPSNAKVDALSGELIALALNMEISALGLVGNASLEELRITMGPFEGELVHTVYQDMSALLSGDEMALERYGMDIEALTDALADINAAGEDCVPSELLKR